MIKYTYDGWDVVREDSSLNGITLYQNGLGIDDKLRSKNGTTIRYFLTDHLGSTEALTDASGTITSSTSYDSFGNAIPKQAAGSAASGAGNAAPNVATSYRYTGREYDADTGLYYYRNRWYDPEIGRFISEDPIGFAGGDVNLYGYVGNNPHGYIDPFGFWRCAPTDPPSGWWDVVQGALDVAGLAPVVGLPADVLNAGISAARGNYTDAALSMAAAVPVLGTAAGAGKIANRLNKARNSLKNFKGKQNRQQRLKDLVDDDKVSSSDRGWIKQEMNEVARGKKGHLRNPPGKDLAHERGRENAKGFGYEHAHLQNRKDHRTQHKLDNFGKKNKER